MKKLTLLLSFVACVVLAQAQTNLLVNPSFEAWAAGVPTGWLLTTSATVTITQATTTDPGQTGSALQVAGPIATYAIQQNVVPPASATTFDTSKTYKLSVSYLVTAGDGTDARVWDGLITSAPGVTTVYYATPTNHADSLVYYIPIHGPGGNVNPAAGVFGNDMNGYLLDNRTSGVWHTYNYSFRFPAGIAQFNFAVRQYPASTVIWDNFFFGEDVSAEVSSPSADLLSVSRSGKTLNVKNVADGSTVGIYSAVGAKVQSAQLLNGSIQLNDLSKGLYIVRVGNMTSKIMM